MTEIAREQEVSKGFWGRLGTSKMSVAFGAAAGLGVFLSTALAPETIQGYEWPLVIAAYLLTYVRPAFYGFFYGMAVPALFAVVSMHAFGYDAVQAINDVASTAINFVNSIV